MSTPPAPAHGSSKIAWTLTGGLLAFGAGWAGGRLGAPGGSRGAPTGAPDLSGPLHALVETESRLASALERLERRLDDSRLTTAPAPARREALDPPEAMNASAELQALTTALESLRQSLERESSETQSLLRAAPVLGGEGLAAVRDRRRDNDWTRLESLEREWRQTPAEADRSQYFQTARDLLETYGPPTAIYTPKSGLLFRYRRHPEGTAGPSLYFKMQDGIVVEFYVEEDEAGEED